MAPWALPTQDAVPDVPKMYSEDSIPIRGTFGLTIVTFERPGCMRTTFGVTIVASERPRCVWTYYSNV